MPIFNCAGPSCTRWISVSAIPGGNPTALEQPEKFAVEYLRCEGCSRYFCDRCLAKIGAGAPVSACPQCDGRLYKPGARDAEAMILGRASSAGAVAAAHLAPAPAPAQSTPTLPAASPPSPATPSPTASDRKWWQFWKPRPDPFGDLPTFAGFSRDGRQFAYASASALGPGHFTIWVTQVGAGFGRSHSFNKNDPGSLDNARDMLRSGEFERGERSPPEGVTLEADLTATPPTVTLVRAGRRETHALGKHPHPPSDQAELWSLTPDGLHAAVHVFGPQVRGVFSPGGAGTMHFYHLLPLP